MSGDEMRKYRETTEQMDDKWTIGIRRHGETFSDHMSGNIFI